MQFNKFGKRVKTTYLITNFVTVPKDGFHQFSQIQCKRTSVGGSFFVSSEFRNFKFLIVLVRHYLQWTDAYC